MTTALKGNATEATVLQALVDRDFAVLIPFGEGHPYDLVLHVTGDRFLRLQCKTARLRNGCIEFNSRSTDHGRGARSYHGLADMFAIHCAGRGTYLVPVGEVPSSRVYLRVEATRNNQVRGTRYAIDYEMERWSTARLSAVRDGSEPKAMDLDLT